MLDETGHLVLFCATGRGAVEWLVWTVADTIWPNTRIPGYLPRRNESMQISTAALYLIAKHWKCPGVHKQVCSPPVPWSTVWLNVRVPTLRGAIRYRTAHCVIPHMWHFWTRTCWMAKWALGWEDCWEGTGLLGCGLTIAAAHGDVTSKEWVLLCTYYTSTNLTLKK